MQCSHLAFQRALPHGHQTERHPTLTHAGTCRQQCRVVLLGTEVRHGCQQQLTLRHPELGPPLRSFRDGCTGSLQVDAVGEHRAALDHRAAQRPRHLALTANVCRSPRLVSRLSQRVGARNVPQALCSVVKTCGRRDAFIVRAASRATLPGSGECTWTTSNRPDRTRRARRNGQRRSRLACDTHWHGTLRASRSGTRCPFQGTTYAHSKVATCGSCAAAMDTSNRSAPPGPKPLITHNTCTATTAT